MKFGILLLTAWLTMVFILFAATNEIRESLNRVDALVRSKNFEAALDSADVLKRRIESSGMTETEEAARLQGLVAEVFFHRGNYKTAAEHFENERKILEIIAPKSVAYASCLNNLSVIYQNLGFSDKAETIILKTLEIKKATVGENDSSYAYSLNNLGTLYFNQGKTAEAEEAYLRAYEIKRNIVGEAGPTLAKAAMNLGIFYKSLNIFDKSKYYLEKAYDIYSRLEIDNQRALAGASLIQTYYALGETDKANELLTEIEDLTDSGVGKSGFEAAQLQYDLGMISWSSRDYEKAKERFTKSIEIVDKSLGKGHPLYSSCASALGILAWMQGDLQTAGEMFNAALQIRLQTLPELHPAIAQSYHNMAGLYDKLGRTDEAVDFYKKAFDLYLKIIDETFLFLGEKEKEDFYAKFKERFGLFNCYVYSKYRERPELLGMMYDYRLATKGILLEDIISLRNQIAREEPNVRDTFERWIETKKTLAKYYNMSAFELKNVGAKPDSLATLAQSLEKKLSRITDKREREASANWTDVQKALGPDEAAVEIIRFNFFDEGWTDKVVYAALVLTAETTEKPKVVFMDNGAEMESKFAVNYKKSIEYLLPDNYSYNIFWKPISDLIPDKKTIYFSKDGIYHKIAINSIKTPKDVFLIEQFNVRIPAKTSDIIDGFADEPLKIDEAVIIGDPDYSVGGELPPVAPPLPGSREESVKIAESIESRHGKAELYLAKKATEEPYKSLDKKASILHFAAHGFFEPDGEIINNKKAFGAEASSANINPLLRSGLLLAKSLGDDGELTAYEIRNSDLGSVKLVTLSACETGLGEIKNGEGVYGLQRAFQIAGAETIVMTLWKVDDFASERLMLSFYQKILDGEGVFAAMKAAQLELKEIYPEPYYWAPYIVLKN